MDSDYAKFLVRVLALCLLGEPGGQFMWVLYGSGGNSKRVVMEVVERLLGIGGSSRFGYAITDEGTFLTATRNAKHESEVAERIVAMRTEGLSAVAIAQRLTDERVPTPGGSEAWAHSTVRRVYLNAEPAEASREAVA